MPRIGQVERPIGVASEDRIERALRVRPGLRLLAENLMERRLARVGQKVPPRHPAERLTLGPQVLSAEIEHRGVGRNF